MKTNSFLANKFGQNLKKAALNVYQTRNKAERDSSHHRGAEEERHAQRYLEAKGFSLIVRNFRCRHGEIDLIMRDQETLVYVEVRQRKNAAYGSPLESISAAKRGKLLKTAQYYAVRHNIGDAIPQRFDVIGLTGRLPNVEVDWIKNAFLF